MARIRTVKPEFFKNYKLYKAEQDEGLPLRLGFEGLWTVADREGRFEWIPEQIKLDVLPYDHVDFGDVLDALERHGYVLSYEVDGHKYGVIPKFREHQVVNQREAQSKLPPPPDDLHVHAHAQTGAAQYVPSGSNVPTPLRQTVYARDGNRCVRCGATDDLTIDHIFPQSIGGTHALENLRTLCRPCNSGRPVAGQGLIDDLAKDGLALSDMQRICMHMHAQVEGKGKEGKGKEETTSSPVGDEVSTADAADPAVNDESMDGSEVIPPCPHRKIVELYHRILPEAPAIRELDDDLQKNLRARWRTKTANGDPRWTLAWWETFFTYIHESCPFLYGQEHDDRKPPFNPGLRWMVKPRNFAKIVEKHYDSRRRAAA